MKTLSIGSHAMSRMRVLLIATCAALQLRAEEKPAPAAESPRVINITTTFVDAIEINARFVEITSPAEDSFLKDIVPAPEVPVVMADERAEKLVADLNKKKSVSSF